MNWGHSSRQALLLRGGLGGLAMTSGACLFLVKPLQQEQLWGLASTVSTTTTGTTGTAGGAAGTTGSSSTTLSGSSMLLGNGGTGSTGVTNPTGTTPISNSNPFQSFYSSPLNAGYGPNAALGPTNAASTNVSLSKRFGDRQRHMGVTVYKATTTTITVNNGIKATTGGAAGATTATTAVGFDTIGIRRTPRITRQSKSDMFAADLWGNRRPVSVSSCHPPRLRGNCRPVCKQP